MARSEDQPFDFTSCPCVIQENDINFLQEHAVHTGRMRIQTMTRAQNRYHVASSGGDMVYFWRDKNSWLVTRRISQVALRQIKIQHNDRAKTSSINRIRRAFVPATSAALHSNLDPSSQTSNIRLLENHNSDGVPPLPSATAAGVTQDKLINTLNEGNQRVS